MIIFVFLSKGNFQVLRPQIDKIGVFGTPNKSKGRERAITKRREIAKRKGRTMGERKKANKS